MFADTVRHGRWSDNDHNFGPFTYSKGYRSWAFLLSSGDGDEYPNCKLRITLGKHTFILWLPAIVKPDADVVFSGTDGKQHIAYMDHVEREYGFSLSENHLQVKYGRQPSDWYSDNRNHAQYWSCFLPWNEWRFVRLSFYGLDGEHNWTGDNSPSRLGTDNLTGKDTPNEDRYEVERIARETCPSRTFSFLDFDGEPLTVKTRIEEREWRRGTGSFKWLSLFWKPRISRSLNLEFSGETGPRKGSWKGGTIGHAIEMLPSELHESAFRRYCVAEDSRSGKSRGMTFIG